MEKNIIDAITEFACKNLNEISNNYLKSRQWNEETIKKWSLGFFPNNKNIELFSILSKYGIKKDKLEDIYVMDLRGNSLFYDRIIFPIWDVHNKLIALTGRTLKDAKPKYYNTDYDKGKNLYGLNFAKECIRELNQAFVFEGNADVITAHQYEINNTVGCQGTAFTKDHFNLISRYASNIYLIFDNDDGGTTAVSRFNKKYKNEIEIRDKSFLFDTAIKEVNVYFIFLYECKDPDEFIKKNGKEKFLEMIKTQSEDVKLQTQRKKILPKR